MLTPTLSSGSRTIPKTTCRKCNRTVLVVEIAGDRVMVEPELIKIVPFAGIAPVIYLARRIHGDLCYQYLLADERAASKAKLRGTFAAAVTVDAPLAQRTAAKRGRGARK